MVKGLKEPKLRFSEYRGTECWKEVKLGELVELRNGYAFQSKSYDEQGVYPVITIKNVSGDTYTNLDKVDYVREIPSNIADYQILKFEDILISMTGNVGRISFNNRDNNLLNQRVGKIEIKENINKYFLFQILKKNTFENTMKDKGQGAAQLNISKGDIEGYVFCIPKSKEEQQKIGQFFTLLDKKINLQQSKIEQLQKYKKGLLQKVMNQEIRFKDSDGQEYPEWEEVKLGELGLFYRGHSYNSSNVVEEGLLVLRSSNIQDDKLVLDKDLQYVNKPCKEDIKLRNKDIVICMANGSKRLVGKAAQYHGEDDNITVGAFCSIFRSNCLLSLYLMQTNQYKQYIDLALEGTNINNLKNSVLEELNFKIPKSIEEQQKIASLFSTIDKKIEKEQEKLSSLKEQKCGFLQKMFV